MSMVDYWGWRKYRPCVEYFIEIINDYKKFIYVMGFDLVFSSIFVELGKGEQKK